MLSLIQSFACSCVRSSPGKMVRRLHGFTPLHRVEEVAKDVPGFSSETSGLTLIEVPGSFKRIHTKGSAHLLTRFPSYFKHLATILTKVDSPSPSKNSRLLKGAWLCGSQ